MYLPIHLSTNKSEECRCSNKLSMTSASILYSDFVNVILNIRYWGILTDIRISVGILLKNC